MQQGRKEQRKREGEEKEVKVVEEKRNGKEKWKTREEKMNEKENEEEKTT